MIDTSKKIMELIQARLRGIEPRIKALEEERGNLAAALADLQGKKPSTPPPSGRKPLVMSQAARNKIRKAQKKRWAAVRAAQAVA